MESCSSRPQFSPVQVQSPPSRYSSAVLISSLGKSEVLLRQNEFTTTRTTTDRLPSFPPSVCTVPPTVPSHLSTTVPTTVPIIYGIFFVATHPPVPPFPPTTVSVHLPTVPLRTHLRFYCTFAPSFPISVPIPSHPTVPSHLLYPRFYCTFPPLQPFHIFCLRLGLDA